MITRFSGVTCVYMKRGLIEALESSNYIVFPRSGCFLFARVGGDDVIVLRAPLCFEYEIT